MVSKDVPVELAVIVDPGNDVDVPAPDEEVFFCTWSSLRLLSTWIVVVVSLLEEGGCDTSVSLMLSSINSAFAMQCNCEQRSAGKKWAFLKITARIGCGPSDSESIYIIHEGYVYTDDVSYATCVVDVP